MNAPLPASTFTRFEITPATPSRVNLNLATWRQHNADEPAIFRESGVDRDEFDGVAPSIAGRIARDGKEPAREVPAL